MRAARKVDRTRFNGRMLDELQWEPVNFTIQPGPSTKYVEHGLWFCPGLLPCEYKGGFDGTRAVTQADGECTWFETKECQGCKFSLMFLSVAVEVIYVGLEEYDRYKQQRVLHLQRPPTYPVVGNRIVGTV